MKSGKGTLASAIASELKLNGGIGVMVMIVTPNWSLRRNIHVKKHDASL